MPDISNIAPVKPDHVVIDMPPPDKKGQNDDKKPRSFIAITTWQDFVMFGAIIIVTARCVKKIYKGDLKKASMDAGTASALTLGKMYFDEAALHGSLKTTADKLYGHVLTQEGQIETLSGQLDEQRKILSEQRETLSGLKKTKENLEHAAAALKGDRAEEHHKILETLGKYDKMIKEGEIELERRKKALEELSEQIRLAKEDLSKTREEIELRRQENAKEETKLRELKADVENTMRQWLALHQPVSGRLSLPAPLEVH